MLEISIPSNSIEPSVLGIRPMTKRPRVVFPQPDSPTIPTVSPLWISKSTPSTARTWAVTGENIPALIGNHFLALRILIKGLMPSVGLLFTTSGASSLIEHSPPIEETLLKKMLPEPKLHYQLLPYGGRPHNDRVQLLAFVAV